MAQRNSVHPLPAPRQRPAARLRGSIENKLVSYAALATASGVGVLATAQTSDAEVIYTPTHQTIAHHSRLNLDVDNDGIADFVLWNASYTHHHTQTSAGLGIDVATPLHGGVYCRTSRTSGGFSFQPIPALAPGVRVGATGKFRSPGGNMAAVSGGTQGPGGYYGGWAVKGGYLKNRYLGIRFLIDGTIHYGWVRMSVRVRSVRRGGITAVLTGYAYETEPNTPIVTGRTSGSEELPEDTESLGELALGAVSKH